MMVFFTFSFEHCLICRKIREEKEKQRVKENELIRMKKMNFAGIRSPRGETIKWTETMTTTMYSRRGTDRIGDS